MTLNEWEQSNIEVLTSREMGEWLGRRENRLLDKIRAEIKSLQNANPLYWHSGDMVERDEVFEIIDKYKAESEE